ncbi:pyruvate decarboxylase-2 [Actinidia rufa]|uniref:Pyruvate decarboxylase-2 n=1 Tax=Actinidia rufa TaxID=165716 RepID=A0A7J0F0W8_9ERIC|nr:pyruvate decarboxylase-2 [Actinidia rufa]
MKRSCKKDNKDLIQANGNQAWRHRDTRKFLLDQKESHEAILQERQQRIDPSKWESGFERHGGTDLGLCIVRTLVNKIGGEIKVVKKNGPVTVFKNSLQELLIDLLTAVVLPLADYMQDYQMTSWDSEVKEGCTSTDLSPEQNPVRVPVQALDDASSIEVLSPQVVNLQKKEEMQESSSEKKLEKTEGISGRRIILEFWALFPSHYSVTFLSTQGDRRVADPLKNRESALLPQKRDGNASQSRQNRIPNRYRSVPVEVAGMEKTLSSLQQPTRVSLGSAIRWSNRAGWKSPGTEKTSVTPIWTRRRAPAHRSRDLDLSFLVAVSVSRCRLRCSLPSPLPSLIDISTSLAGLLVRERETELG